LIFMVQKFMEGVIAFSLVLKNDLLGKLDLN